MRQSLAGTVPLFVAEAQSALREAGATTEELLSAFLERPSVFEPTVNAFISSYPEQALGRARAIDSDPARHRDMPLRGIPVSIKDHIHVNGMATSYGLGDLRENLATADATVVDRLRTAGAIILGKNNMDPLARGAMGENPWFGAVKNPWNDRYSPGGSSSGSAAAVATRQVLGAMGSDGGGSLRIPAAMCGVSALKPSPGLVSKYNPPGSLWATNVFLGPIAPSVACLGQLLNVIAGPDPLDPTSTAAAHVQYMDALQTPLRGARIGIPEDYFFDRLSPDVDRAVRTAATRFDEIGTELHPVKIRHFDQVEDAWRIISLVERVAGGNIPTPKGLLQTLPEKYRVVYELGELIPAVAYVNARKIRRLLIDELDKVFEDCDVLLTPTCAVAEVPASSSTVNIKPSRSATIQDAFEQRVKVRVGSRDEDAFTAVSRLTRPFNLTGHPALTVPCGFSTAGIPIGLQLVGPYYSEASLLQLGHAYQEVTAWHRVLPQVPTREAEPQRKAGQQ